VTEKGYLEDKIPPPKPTRKKRASTIVKKPIAHRTHRRDRSNTIDDRDQLRRHSQLSTSALSNSKYGIRQTINPQNRTSKIGT